MLFSVVAALTVALNHCRSNTPPRPLDLDVKERLRISDKVGIRQQLTLKGGAATQAHPRSRDSKAALTRGPVRGEVGADFCLLGMKVLL